MSEQVLVGWHAVVVALRTAPHELIRIFLDAQRRDARAAALSARAAALGVELVRTERKFLDALAHGVRHQGVVALQRAKSHLQDSLKERLQSLDRPVVLVADGVTDPRNFGAMLRSAAAFGVAAVLAPKDKSCGITPVVRKVASGAAELLPIFFVTNLVRELELCKKLGLWVIGLAAEEQALSIERCDLASRGVALVVGAEEKGLRRLTRASCDELVRIPMLGAIESLNVAVATGIALFEVLRQKRLAEQKG